MRLSLFILSFFLLNSGIILSINNTTYIDLSGNAYVTKENQGEDKINITDSGLLNWNNSDEIISVYFHVEEPQKLDISLLCSGNSTIKMSYLKKSHVIKLNSDSLIVIPAGKFQIKKAGYVRIDIQGINKKDESFGNIQNIILNNTKGKVTYVHDFSNYWGKRGPSVHMAYLLPKDTIEWFYNEVIVPKEGEVIGSYYMTNGFGEGYCGIQYNSPTERRILFSIWSPFETDNPNDIPEDEKIILLRKGEGVNIGEFGNEGSGGQSFLRYNWKAGVQYKFLTQVHPDKKGNTIYTAYFYAPDEDKWRLIASFLRPKTTTWYRGAHSFLENFIPSQGYITRSVEFGNQWALDKNGKWHELTEGIFTYDATAHAGVRLDYQGGTLKNNHFYLKNGGFFDNNTQYKSKFTRKSTGISPIINFDNLIKL